MNYIAHIRKSDGQIQTVEEHLLGVKDLAESYGEKIGVKHIAGLAGMLHDMGKYTHQFRDYILEAVRNPDSPPRRGSVDHSTAGGKLLYERFHTGNPSMKWILAEVVGNAIISHHSYLHDFLNDDRESNYLHRVRDKEHESIEFDRAVGHFFEKVMGENNFEQYVSKALIELEAYVNKPYCGTNAGRLMFLTKFVFSALIDADRTNTRVFEENIDVEPKQCSTELFRDYYEKLMTKIDLFRNHNDAQTAIHSLRREMSDQCDEFASRPSGIYTVSIPTGGGKTLASLRYALKHAIRYGKKHIVYVVPYTTIIEQNAAEVRRILQDDSHILEHHSNVIEDTHDDDEDQDGVVSTRQKLKLAKDNWDSPIVFTTMVQFLNVFYAKGSRNIRRLHNLSESVIIFDEVQKVPVRCVSLFNQALNFLKAYGHSSLILCTATQPALYYVKNKLEMNTDGEMIHNLERVIEAFKRVEIIDKATEETFNNDKLTDFIAEKLNEVRSVLVILNTKAVVKNLFCQLEGSGVPIYHLSTSMCAAHRNHILGQVKAHLEKGEKVICVSTQLIEAGVDISFDCVIRSLAGLDSIAQAAGRCNRHGENDIQQVYVIDHEEENLDHLREIKIGKQVSRKILVDLKRNRSVYGGNILSAGAMDKYFKELYSEFDSSLDYFIPKLGRDMTVLLTSDRNDNPTRQSYQSNKGEDIPLVLVNSYRTAAEHFQVIENLTTSVIAPYEAGGKDIIAKLNGDETIEDLSRRLREAQQYTVNLFKYEREQLDQKDGLVYLLDGKVLALKESAYNVQFGLDLENDSGFDLSMY